jgi:hypothetical protein
MKLYFSAWVVSLINNNTIPDKVNMIFTLEDNTGAIIVQYHNGTLPDVSPTWKQYGFEFTVPAGLDSLVFRITNNSTGGNGNDYCLDDIAVRLCAPSVVLSPMVSDTAICVGSSFVLSGTYTDDGTFGNSLSYSWEHSLTGDVNNPAAWTSIVSNTMSSPLNVNYPIASMSAADTGYYRLVVSNSSGINSPNCRAASAPMRLFLYSILTPPANQTVSACTHTDSVTFTGTNVEGSSCTWVNDNPAIGLPASGTGNIPSFMATNTTNAPITGNITVTSKSSAGCGGTTETFSITVTPTTRPKPSITIGVRKH